MTTQKTYLAEILKDGKLIKTIIYGHNENQAKEYADKIGSLISIFCMGEAITEFED